MAKQTVAAAGGTTAQSELKLAEGFGRGLASDVKDKSKFYLSDLKDGFSIKVTNLDCYYPS